MPSSSFKSNTSDEEVIEFIDENENEVSGVVVCSCCKVEVMKNLYECFICKCLYHKSCIKNHLYTQSTCKECHSYDFVRLHSRNFGPREIQRNYYLQVFYAKPFECIRINARKKLDFLIRHEIIKKEIEDTKGNTLLNVACFFDHIEIVKMLIVEHQLNIYHSNSKQDFSVHICCQAGNIEILKYLLFYEPDIKHLLNANGQTPLHVAIVYDNPNIACLLTTSMSVDKLKLEDANGDTPLALIKKRKNSADFKNVIQAFLLAGVTLDSYINDI